MPVRYLVVMMCEKLQQIAKNCEKLRKIATRYLVVTICEKFKVLHRVIPLPQRQKVNH